jgi:ferredoxin-NADP reductase/MOSC domain-containing protein YiiM
MQVLSVNVGLPREVVYQGRIVKTGIFKEAVRTRVRACTLGLEGDGQADLTVHGGSDMAVYAYPRQHYGFWEAELGRRDLPFGQFGENLTIEGLSEEATRVGDRFRIGTTLLQVTQPRIPCYKLAIRMAQPSDFPRRFQATGRLGFYFRICEQGDIGAGDAIELVDRDEASVTIAEFVDTYVDHMQEPGRLTRILASRDLSESWCGFLKKALRKAEPGIGSIGWTSFRPFVVDRKIVEGRDVTSFYLAPVDGAPPPAFKPGQFLTFRFTIPGHPRPVTRTYSLSSAPRSDHYRITVKRTSPPPGRSDLPGGLSSTYLHDCVERGARLCVKAPRGDFHLDPLEPGPVVLLSGGVGITPMISMLEAIVESGSSRPVWFVHGARNGQTHIMGALARRIATEHPNVRVHICYSHPNPDDVLGRDYDDAGHVSIDLIRRLLQPDGYEFYLCGPTPFMKSLYAGLLDWSVPEARIHYEHFGPATVLAPVSPGDGKAAADGNNANAVEVLFARSGLTANWDPSVESLLDLAEVKGLRPDYNCRSGVCHTCISRLIEGHVDYFLDVADQPDPGYVLICCSRPRGRVVIDL